MKNKGLFLAAGMSLLTLAFSACDRMSSEDAISEDEVVDIIENTISSESEGYLAQVQDAADIVDSYESSSLKALVSDTTLSQYCGMGFDSTITRSKTTGTRTYSFEFSWAWSLSCTELDHPESFDFSFSGNGNYDALRMSSDDEFSTTFMLSGLEATSLEFMFNGTYTREGTQQSKVLDKQSFESKVVLSASDITLGKLSRTINGGEISFTLTGNSSGGDSFSKNGTIVLNGDGTATVSISNGGSHIIEI